AKAAGRNGPLGLKPAVARGAKDLGPSELKELEFALERPAAELPDAQVPLAEPLGQFLGVTGPQRLQGHERLLWPRAPVARLPVSDLYRPHAPIPWEAFSKNPLPAVLLRRCRQGTVRLAGVYRPGPAPALGLRAGGVGPILVPQTGSPLED